MSFLTLWLNSGLVILGLMTALWLISLSIKNSSIVDIFWGMGFVIIFWVGTLLVPSGLTARTILLGVIVSIWGLRLSLHIFQRNHGNPEDFRYAKWREEAGKDWWWRSLFKVFVLQGALMWIIAIPLLAAQTSRASNSALACYDLIAAIIWLTGFAFEAGGDYQLARFKAGPANKGKLLTTGFWSVTRHPNYWGDAVQWWAFYLLVLISGAWWTVFSPIIMTLLLRNVSGVVLLEKTLRKNKPDYAEYIANTPAFMPRILRRKKKNLTRKYMSRIKDKIIVITGSTRGFGFAIAESMLEAGAIVAITGRSQKAVDSALVSLRSKGRVSGFVMDVREEEQVYKLVEYVIKEFGRIDIWVNNAGYSNAAGMMLDMNPRDALDMFMSNDLGVLQCTQAIMGYMLPRKQGLLINIYGNGSFLRPASPTGLYGATKAWITSFTRSLAKELKGSGVQILGFSPGMMTTDMLTNPIVIGERGREMMKNFGFVLRFLSKPAKYSANKLVKAIEGNHREFTEVKLFKPWTPLLGLIRVGWENLTKTGKTPEFEIRYQEVYKSKYLPEGKIDNSIER